MMGQLTRAARPVGWARRALVRAASSTSSAASSRPAFALESAPEELRSKFKVVSNEFLEEHGAWAALLEHKATGGRMVSVEAPTESGGDEKVFGIAFSTPPANSAGVAHILEHSVLCGSERYPCKEPFAELLRSSQQTFLNAMTYPDRTVYPVASLNEKDFRNLVGVYMDAVFRPRLSPWTLMQEGWRLEPKEDGARHGLSGVVYSEMKGVYSSADSLHAVACGQALFEGQSYGVSSGGDPPAIPSLSYRDFVDFHRRNYRPERAHVFFWGDDDVAERLRVVDEYFAKGNIHDEPGCADGAGDPLPDGWPLPQGLKPWWPRGGDDGPSYSPVSPDATVPVPDHEVLATPPWGAPRSVRVVYPSPSTDEARTDDDSGHFVSLCWALQDGGVREGEAGFLGDCDRLGLLLLSSLLLGTQSAPLYRRAIQRTGASAVIGGGLASHTRQGVFEVGVKGVWKQALLGDASAPDDDVSARVQKELLGILEEVAADGFVSEHVEAELNTLEFAVREFGAGGTPKGLSLFLGMAGPWIYGREPLGEMRFERSLQQLRERIAADGSGYLVGLLREHLLDNAHRATVHSVPSSDVADRLRKAEDEAVAAAVGAMGEEERQRLQEASVTLKRRQETPDSEAAIATIPVLTRADLKREAAVIPSHDSVVSAGPGSGLLRSYALPSTNGISHVSASFDVGAYVRPDQVQWLPLFAQLLTTTGTADRDDVAMSHVIGAATGGIAASATATPVVGQRGAARLVMTLGGKALDARVPDLSAIMLDLLLTAPLGARHDLLAAQVRESVAATEGSLVSAGHRHAMSVLGATLSFPGEISHAMGGLPQLAFLRDLRSRLDAGGSATEEAHAEAAEALEAVRSAVLAAARDSRDGAGTLLTALGGPESIAAAQEAAVAVATGAAAAPHASSHPLPTPSEHATLGRAVGQGSSLACDMRPLQHMGQPGGYLDSAHAVTDGQPAPRVAVLVPSTVSYVCQAGIGFDAAPDGDVLPGPASAHVSSSVLSLGHLWDSVRVRGNAYGAGSSVDAVSGAVSFWSYRDPRIQGTLDDFAASADWMRSSYGGSDDDAVDRAVISSVGGIDKPASPVDKASQATTRWLLGLDPETVQRRRESILDASTQVSADLGDAIDLAASDERRRVCVVTGRDAAMADGIIGSDGAAADGWTVVDAFGTQRS